MNQEVKRHAEETGPDLERNKKRQKIDHKKDMELLSTVEVHTLLANLGMPVPMKTIQEHYINGDLLACCASHTDLTELGVTIANAKQTLLLKKISKFAQEGVPVELITLNNKVVTNARPLAAKEAVPGVVVVKTGSPVSTLSQDSIDYEVNTTVQASLAETRLSQVNAKNKRMRTNDDKNMSGQQEPIAPINEQLPVVSPDFALATKNGAALLVPPAAASNQEDLQPSKNQLAPTTELLPVQQVSHTSPLPPLAPTEAPRREKADLRYDNGDVYRGTLVNGIRQGHGVMVYNSEGRGGGGGVYEGMWEGDQRQGEGTMAYTGRNQYCGQWKRDVPEGRGRMTFESGSEYRGLFVDGQILGHGVMRYANGDEYDGYYLRGSREGPFVSRYQSGDCYRGNYAKNRKQGEGAYTTAQGEGEVYSGTFERGVLTGSGTAVLAGGKKKYNGNFENREFHGWGRLLDENTGDEYVGDFVRGKKEGKGVLQQGNGVTYKGEWRENKRHGQGVMTNENGVLHEGMFHEDRFSRYKSKSENAVQPTYGTSHSSSSYPVVVNQRIK